MDRGAWWATVHRVAKCQTRLKQLSTYACITVAMFAWVNLGSHIPFATRDILEVGLAWPYPWRVCYHSEYPEPPSPLQPGSWICWRKYKLLKNMWQKVTFERKTFYWRISSVQFSHSVVSDSLWPHESQHARPPCLSATPGVHPNSCALSQWCHPAISSSVVPLSFCPHQFSSVQFSRSVMSDSLQPHELQHARLPCPSWTPGVHSNSRPSSRWCHPAISSSVVPFSSCPQSLPASESFPMSQLFAWGQSTGVSALASFLPKKSQDWSSLGWTGWISLQSKGLSRVFSNTTVQKHQFFGAQLSLQSNFHIHT